MKLRTELSDAVKQQKAQHKEQKVQKAPALAPFEAAPKKKAKEAPAPVDSAASVVQRIAAPAIAGIPSPAEQQLKEARKQKEAATQKHQEATAAAPKQVEHAHHDAAKPEAHVPSHPAPAVAAPAPAGPPQPEEASDAEDEEGDDSMLQKDKQQ